MKQASPSPGPGASECKDVSCPSPAQFILNLQKDHLCLGADPQLNRGMWGPSNPRAGQIGSGARPKYLHGDDVPGPEVEVDGVQWGGQCHPLPLAVDGRREGCRRWEAAKGLHWHLEGDVMSQRVLGIAKLLCCCRELGAKIWPHGGDRAREA